MLTLLTLGSGAGGGRISAVSMKVESAEDVRGIEVRAPRRDQEEIKRVARRCNARWNGLSYRIDVRTSRSHN